jgi:predicted AAA+ superfamily ATPase
LITGSNSKLLSHELATHLTGRHVEFNLHPFSFEEFLIAKNFKWSLNDFNHTEGRAQIVRYFGEYVETGGFPEMVVHGYNALYLRELFDKIISRDIVDRHGVKFGRTLKEIALYGFSNLANRITFHKIRKIFELKSVQTVKNYVEYLEEAYLLTLVPAFSFKFKEQIKQARKLYTVDNGMSRAMRIKSTGDHGAGLENMVHQELKRRGLEIYYWTTPDSEVDFLVKKNREISELIQVCLTLQDADTRKRELKALFKAAEKTKCTQLRILTWDEEHVIKEGKYTMNVEPVWKWMLSLG